MDRKGAGAALRALCLIGLLTWSSCKSKDPLPDPVPDLAGRYVLVACEGLFGQGNAEVSVYKPEGDEASAFAYQAANGSQLGDVLQSITLVGNQLLLCVNNSDKVLAVSAKDLRAGRSAAIPKPRYVLPVSESKVYVSSLYHNRIYILNPQDMQVTGEVSLPKLNPEGMLLRGNSAWVACWDTACDKLYAVDVHSDAVTDSIALPGAAPQEVVEDAEGKIWVLSGNVYRGKAAHLVRIDPATGMVLKDFVFPAAADPLRLCMTPGRDSLYFLEVDYSGGTGANGVYRMSIGDNALPPQAFVPAAANQYFYGIGIEPRTSNVYVADPIGFQGQGAVHIYNPQGQLLKTFRTGIGPGHFFFQP